MAEQHEGQKREKIETFRAVVNPSKDNPLWDLIAKVGSKKCTLQQATTEFRAYISGLTPEELEKWKAGALTDARYIMSVAEAFNQEVTVIVAGQ